MKSMMLTLALLAAAPANAAVSGFYDSAEQISVILGSNQVADKVRQLPIKDLSFEGQRQNGTLKWEVETEHCEVDVFLRAIPPAALGKTTYEIAEVRDCD